MKCLKCHNEVRFHRCGYCPECYKRAFAPATESPRHSSSKLTPELLEECRKMFTIEVMPRADFFLNPQAMEALTREKTPAPDPISSILGMPFFVMENQKADCWVISDPQIAKAYRNGDISEETLKCLKEKIVEIQGSGNKNS